MNTCHIKLAVLAASMLALAGTGCTKDPEHVFKRTNPLDPKGVIFETFRTYGGSEEDHFHSLTPTQDGGYLMAGTTYSGSLGAGAPNLWAVKTDAAGNVQWQRVYGGDMQEYDGTAIATLDGGYVLVGNSRSFSPPYSDIYLIKTDGTGTPLWEKTYGGQYDDVAKSVRQAADSGFVIAGFSTNANAGWLLRTDKAGDTLWTRTFQGNGFEVELAADGGYIVAAGLWLIKFDGTGNQSWINYDCNAYKVEAVPDGYVAVYQNNITKVGLNGENVWKRTLGCQGQDLTKTPQGDLLVTGLVPDNSNSASLVKLDNQGNIKWTLAFPTVGTGKGVHWRGDGSCVVAGHTKAWGGDGFFLKTKPYFEEGM